MKKTTKGALAAAAAGTLLVGGAGTLAFWTDSATVDGTSVNSGHLTLAETDCGDWQLDTEGGPGGDLGSRTLVPGDVLTKVCTYDLDASGAHLAATLDVSTPSWTGDLADALTTSADFKLDSTVVTPGTPVAVPEGDDHVVTASFKVTFNAATTDHMDVNAALGAITLSVAQTAHPAVP